MVPLALVAKAPMRDLDVVDASGAPLPVLGRREDGDLALSLLVHVWQKAVGRVDDETASVLERVVRGDAAEAVPLAERVVSGEALKKSDAEPVALPDVLSLLVTDLAANFLLVCLLPADKAGARQVIKWSANWHITAGAMTRWERVASAFGRRAVRILIPVSGASSVSSYHLEVHVPDQLVCVRLALPPGHDNAGGEEDTSTNPIAHVHGSYAEAPQEQDAELDIAVPVHGARFHAAFAATFTATVFLLAQLLPGAQRALLDAGGGAAGLLLVAPGLLIAIGARAGENILASRLLAPLRASMIGCAALLTGGAASLVGRLHTPWFDAFWSIGALASLALAVVLWWSRWRVGGDV
jgi:hypothetical protein